MSAETSIPYHVAGTYLEACNCEAVCPCRKVGDSPAGPSQYGHCDFALSWMVETGSAGATDLSGLSVVMAGSWFRDGEPWHVVLYVDERASDTQCDALADIFLGRAGGETLRNFAGAIGEVYAVRRARIALEHAKPRRRINAGEFVTVEAFEDFPTDEPVYCGIPGYDQPGQELRAGQLRVDDPPLRWTVTGRCGFSRKFSYRSTG